MALPYAGRDDTTRLSSGSGNQRSSDLTLFDIDEIRPNTTPTFSVARSPRHPLWRRKPSVKYHGLHPPSPVVFHVDTLDILASNSWMLAW